MTETIKAYLIDLFSHYNSCANSLASEIDNLGLSDKEKFEVAKELKEAQRHRDTLKKCIDSL